MAGKQAASERVAYARHRRVDDGTRRSYPRPKRALVAGSSVAWTRSCTTRHRRTCRPGRVPHCSSCGYGMAARNGLPTRRHLRHTSRPGHLRQPGSETVGGALTSVLSARRTSRAESSGSGGSAAWVARHADGWTAGQSGTEARRRSAYPGHRRVRGAGANVRRRSGAHTPLGLASADTHAADGYGGGEHGHPDGRASVTCAGAHDPKPQCRVGRLTECPACAGRGDTSLTDDPIRKCHQDL